jgi:hypothetical protein|tara:strand:+ start:339 stop:488 length:150 start_codon:yes stop_codon:yes gene_type:complete
MNPYDITVNDPRELSSDIQSEIMSEADADFICEIHIDEINSWLRERSIE